MANNVDLTSPPSKQELALFAPPSQDELQATQHLAGPANPTQSDKDIVGQGTILSQEQQRFSPIESAGLGALKWGTANLALPAEAGIRAGIGSLSGEQGRLADLYAKYRALTNQKYDQAYQENPKAYAGGAIAGALATAPLIPELGIGETLAESANLAGATGLGSALAGESGSALANIAGKAASSVSEGLPLGGVISAAGSKYNLIGASPEEQKKYAEDIGHGMATGSLVGGGLSIAKDLAPVIGNKISGAASSIGDYLKREVPYFGKNIPEAYKTGSELGIDMSNQSAKEAVYGSSASSAAILYVKKIMATRDMLGQKVGEALDNAQKSGVWIDVTDPLKSAAQSANEYFSANPALPIDPKTRAVLRSILNNKISELNPVEAKGIKDNIYQVLSTFKGVNTDVANTTRQIGGNLANAIDSELKSQIPEYRQAADQFYQFNRKIPESIQNPGIPTEMITQQFGPIDKTNLFEKTKDLISQAMTPGAANKDYLETFGIISKNLRQLEQDNPAAIESLGGKGATADSIINDLRNSSNTESLYNQYYGHQNKGSMGGGAAIPQTALSGISGISRGSGLYMANKAGLGMKAISESVPVKYTSNLYSLPEQALRGVSAQLKSTDFGRHYGEALENALNNKNEALKNAVLFSILQNPNLRNSIGASLTGENKVSSSGQQQ